MIRVCRGALVGAAAILAACGSGPAVNEIADRTLAVEGGSTPTVAIDPADGAVFVAWVGMDADEANVFLARIDADGTAHDPVRVNSIPGDASPHDQAPAQVAVGPDGNVYVAWQSTAAVEWLDFGAAEVRLSRSTDGGRSFEPAVTVTGGSDDAPARKTFHDLAVAPDGTVYISWIDARERDRFRRDRFVRGAGRTATRTLASPAGDETVASPAAEWAPGSAMRAIAAHPSEFENATEDREPQTDVRVARSTDGGRTFSPGVVVDTASCPCCRTAIAVDRDGVIHVAWRKIHDGEVRDVAVARSEDGGLSFSAPVRAREDGWVFPGCPHAGPSLAVDGDGALHLAWYTGREGRPGVFHASSSEWSRGFGPATDVMAGDWVPASQVKLAADGPTVWIAWDDRRHEEPEVRLAAIGSPRRNGSEASTIHAPIHTARGLSPALAAANGRVVLAWLDGEAVRVWIGEVDR